MAYDETTHDKINGFPVAIIDDTETTTGVHTWTGKKINSEFENINSSNNPLFYMKTYTYTAESVAANASINISKNDFGIDDIDGYTPIIMARSSIGKAGFAITAFNARGVSAVLSVSNTTNAAIVNTSFTIQIVFVKSNFLQNLT